MSELIADEDLIKTFTGKTVKRCQCEELEFQAIPYTKRRDGSPVVARKLLLDRLGISETEQKQKSNGPDFTCLQSAS